MLPPSLPVMAVMMLPIVMMCVVRSIDSSGKKFFQMVRFDAGADEGGVGWLLQAEPAVDKQPW